MYCLKTFKETRLELNVKLEVDMLIKEILDKKGRIVYSVSPDTMVYDAIKLMSDKNIGSLVVIKNNRLAGIVSERDYRNKVILLGRHSKDTPVKDIMTEEVLCVQETETVESCMKIMTDKKIRHLPVVNKKHEADGMISIGDLVNATINKQKVEISTLKGYIYGEYPG